MERILEQKVIVIFVFFLLKIELMDSALSQQSSRNVMPLQFIQRALDIELRSLASQRSQEVLHCATETWSLHQAGH